MLTIQRLRKSFGKKPVLNQITYTFGHGVYGLLGPNGAGKTTLMRCITKLYPVKKDTILHNGVSIHNNKDYLTQVGYLPQKFGMFRDLTVYEVLEMMAGVKGMSGKGMKERILQCLDQVNLSDQRTSRVRTLSGGMVRRLGIAQVLLNDPDVMVFDEPTAGLDPEERLRFKRIVANISKDKTVLISTHIVNDVEASCDTVVVLNEGRVAASGSCEEIRQHAQGKVYLVPQANVSQLQGDYVVQSQFEENREIILRVLSAQKQAFALADPTTEDGYICILKNI